MNIRIPLSYLCDLFGQLQLILLVFVKCVLLVSSFIFFLKRGKVMDAYGIHSIFFTHKCFIFSPYFLFIPYGFRFRLNILKSIVKSQQMGVKMLTSWFSPVLESNFFLSTIIMAFTNVTYMLNTIQKKVRLHNIKKINCILYLASFVNKLTHFLKP